MPPPNLTPMDPRCTILPHLLLFICSPIIFVNKTPGYKLTLNIFSKSLSLTFVYWISFKCADAFTKTLYSLNINPITFLTGAGLVNFGQKTRARNASALDRINVARLVIYLRSQLKKLAKPYIFEPNDKITRDEIKAQVDSLMLELVSQRALYDFLVVCDESNNTPSRIDRNELYVDIAIEPVKAVEFIYIPLRLKNTGEIAGL